MIGPDLWLGDIHLTDATAAGDQWTTAGDPVADLADAAAAMAAQVGFAMSDWQRAVFEKYMKFMNDVRPPVNVRPGLIRAGRVSEPAGNVVHIVTTI